jgi:uncharacterized membrane protein SpoIIM required for sporulation
MINKIQRLENNTRFSILITTLAIAVFMVLSINAVISLVYVSQLVQQLDYEYVSFSYSNGYYTINNHKIGIPLFFNLLAIILLWYFMVSYTLKIINKQIDVFS